MSVSSAESYLVCGEPLAAPKSKLGSRGGDRSPERTNEMGEVYEVSVEQERVKKLDDETGGVQ